MEAMQAYEAKMLINGKELQISTGKLAKQAGGAVLVRYADSMVLVTATRSKMEKDLGYFPLSVEFEEKMYAAGKMPGGFIKREGRPSENAIISARLVDRSIRPLFPKDFKKEVQVVCLTMSSDMSNPIDVCAIVGASAALGISDIPFEGPIASIRVGRIDGKFIANPTYEEQEKSDLNIVVAGTEDSIMMVEGEANEISEKVFLEGVDFAREIIGQLVALQRGMIEKMGKPKAKYDVHEIDEALSGEVVKFVEEKVKEALNGKSKEEREEAMEAIRAEAVEKYGASDEGTPDAQKAKDIGDIIEKYEKKKMREMIVNSGVRPDGRAMDEIRPISCETGLTPRTHGSALFTRGQTQVLSTVTLGSIRDAQRIDGISNDSDKPYIHQYNFPPFS
ncbi:MAG TPA: polyribonucleotide nucleotidyltransferase, partial [bacterium]|nr:polyribonucleotide nucleotidyltransferase [bacterium]